MTQTITIKRSDLKKKHYKAYSATASGAMPTKRSTEHLADVLKILLKKKSRFGAPYQPTVPPSHRRI